MPSTEGAWHPPFYRAFLFCNVFDKAAVPTAALIDGRHKIGIPLQLPAIPPLKNCLPRDWSDDVNKKC